MRAQSCAPGRFKGCGVHGQQRSQHFGFRALVMKGCGAHGQKRSQRAVDIMLSRGCISPSGRLIKQLVLGLPSNTCYPPDDVLAQPLQGASMSGWFCPLPATQPAC